MINGLLQLLQFPGRKSRKSSCVHLVLVVLGVQYTAACTWSSHTAQIAYRHDRVDYDVQKCARACTKCARAWSTRVYRTHGPEKLSSNSNFESSFVLSLKSQTNVRTFVRSFHP